ncbi:protein jagged-2-like [Watersipora subatra]|uniref:protein jagged-2-like n=1 Tax=Watersipora subatra TaxID=2589382 RepID=UPI00355AE802
MTLSVFLLSVSLLALTQAQTGPGSAPQGLSCPRAGYMIPDENNLCFVWFCEAAGVAPMKRACPKGVRVPSWWEGGELNMCFIVNIVKHFGEPVCLRCDANDIPPTAGCASNPCKPECECEEIEHTFRCNCPDTGLVTDAVYVPPRDHCSPNPCRNGASCQNQWDGYFCFCPSGWTGHDCELSGSYCYVIHLQNVTVGFNMENI